MSIQLKSVVWPADQLGQALEALADATGLRHSGGAVPRRSEGEEMDRWLIAAGHSLGVEVEAIEARYFEVENLVCRCGPALVEVSTEGRNELLLLLSGGRRSVRVLGPDLRIHRLRPEAVRAALAAELEAPVSAGIDTLLDRAQVAPRRRDAARRALLEQHLGPCSVSRCWILRAPPGSSFWRQLLRARVVLGTSVLLVTHLVQNLLFLASWWLIGRGALFGQLDMTWILGWALLLLSVVPLRMLIVLLQGRVILGAGSVMKRRLLHGVLQLDLEQIRHEGAGMLLGRVLEANSFEALVLAGGYLAVLAVIDVAIASWVLAQGAGGAWHAALFLCWAGLTGALMWRFYRAVKGWATARIDLTHDLTERMVGHRTRLAQQAPGRWHEGEDGLLNHYLEISRRMDAIAPWVSQSHFGWRLVGLLGLAAPFVSGNYTATSLAVGLGGVLLGGQALARLNTGSSAVAVAAIAWRKVAPIFDAAAREERPGSTLAPSQAGAACPEVLTTRNVVYTYPNRARPAVNGIDLKIRSGDRLLLTGPSGGGKSTLVSLLTGLREPESGLVLCTGLDMPTLGTTQWRSRVAAAPQFHDNHVLAETFAFNLLMGRAWPPTAQALAEAEELCRELGLGELLDRMPGGMLQVVGDTGWQLSHGEQSRLFVARALLQDSDLVILDESFGALDPPNLKRAVDCARRRAKTLLVVAHP